MYICIYPDLLSTIKIIILYLINKNTYISFPGFFFFRIKIFIHPCVSEIASNSHHVRAGFPKPPGPGYHASAVSTVTMR